MFSRKDLEAVIQKKKLDEVINWFSEHFVTCSQYDYIQRGPLVIFQGPTGCGKSTVLRWISDELRVPIKEFNETTDLTSIEYDLASRRALDYNQSDNVVSADRRKAQKFEQFVIDNIRYKSLIDRKCVKDGVKTNDGVIIHIETPLSFARTQQASVHVLCRLLKIVKELSKTTPRRVAIVFENIDGDNETLTLSGKLKLSLGIQTIKFNPITNSNMKKLIRYYLSNLIQLDDDTIERLITNSRGDMTACIKTLQLICNTPSDQIHTALEAGRKMQPSYKSDSGYQTQSANKQSIPPAKKQKFSHGGIKNIRFDANLMRDTTQSPSYFHWLGKIFYQKRHYPPTNSLLANQKIYYSQHNYLERPFQLENDPETLLTMIYIQPENLLTWLHDHYHGFCAPYNLVRAENFIENLTDVDLVSINSSQSSQFYEFHKLIDELQAHLAINATTFTLYHNMLLHDKKTYKEVNGTILKSSVEKTPNVDTKAGDSIYSFKKPLSMEINTLAENYSKLIDICHERSDGSFVRNKLTTEYLPYLGIIGRNRQQKASNLTFKPKSQNGSMTPTPINIHEDYLLESFELLDDYFDGEINSRLIEKRIDNISKLIENWESKLTDTQSSGDFFD